MLFNKHTLFELRRVVSGAFEPTAENSDSGWVTADGMGAFQVGVQNAEEASACTVCSCGCCTASSRWTNNGHQCCLRPRFAEGLMRR